MPAAQHLPPALRGDLLEPARQAFITGLNAAVGIGALLLAGLATLAAILLRHLPPTSETDQNTEETASDDHYGPQSDTR